MAAEAFSPGFWDLVRRETSFSFISGGYTFTEGPMWHSRKKYLVWTDIIGDKILKWTPGVGTSVLMSPAGHPDGTFIDRQGRLVVAGWSSRTVWRLEHDGSTTVLASHYQGKKLNTPNDIVVKSDGSIYFTDPSNGLRHPGHTAGDIQKYIDYEGVYRLDPDSRTLTLLVQGGVNPNGLCFSPDESLLYINSQKLGFIHVYTVGPDGMLGNERLFAELVGNDPGAPDGMKCDALGNVWCTGPGGVWALDPKGNPLGRIRTPEETTNFTFGGDDMKTIYFATPKTVYATTVNVAGIALP
jgi:gluconolactonase